MDADAREVSCRASQRPAPDGPCDRAPGATLGEQVEPFAGYGFNQGHATAYADVSYRRPMCGATGRLRFFARGWRTGAAITTPPPHRRSAGWHHRAPAACQLQPARVSRWCRRPIQPARKCDPCSFMGWARCATQRQATVQAIIDERPAPVCRPG